MNSAEESLQNPLSGLQLLNTVYKPDVLQCLANLSNDEVFTPPQVVNEVLDLLPEELWSNPDITFLDPVSKTGVFLREIAKRLLKGLEHKIPDLQERVNHIFQKQLFGIAITELTGLLSRRSVYCSKNAASEWSVAKFKDKDGNICFRRIKHTWKDGQCTFCGASQKEYDRAEKLESHAYLFIHKTIKEIFGVNMKFDVIVGNPPYQLNDGGNGVSAKPLFHHFVLQAKKLNPRYLTMIIPARWYAGGKGLDDFRENMLGDSHVRTLVDYESSKECFSGVNIAGGICYFLWDRDYSGQCNITNVIGTQKDTQQRPLNEFPILIRSNMAVSIVHKVLRSGVPIHSEYAYPRNPFGFSTNFRGRDKREENDIEIITSVGTQFISRTDVKKNNDIIDLYKILIGRLVPSNGELDVNPKDGYKVITDTRIIGPGQINTETYLDIGVFPTKEEAYHFEKYLHCKFPRFLLRQAISSLNVTRECFRFVPHEDFSEEWTDKKLYKKYGLSQKEIDFIETLIRPMGQEDTNE